MNKNLFLTITLLTGTAGLSAAQPKPTTTDAVIGFAVIGLGLYTTYKLGSWLFGPAYERMIERQYLKIQAEKQKQSSKIRAAQIKAAIEASKSDPYSLENMYPRYHQNVSH